MNPLSWVLLPTVSLCLLLLSSLGIPAEDLVIDARTAEEVLPYARLAEDVYNSPGTTSVAGWSRVEWQDVYREAGKASEIPSVAASGFYAAVYRNQKTGEVVLSFRG
ncbi:hypothetical protein, partial [Rhodoplanes sp. SY1]|uniref:hypothetical protein n=1 Tax=Rhodoplanes sp. SY1 TaxID=3166646 RepID=UPI0038B68F93